MSQIAFDLLYQAYQNQCDEGDVHLWLLGDTLPNSSLASLLGASQTRQCRVITNRWDIAQLFSAHAEFNDFELSFAAEFNRAYFYIPKEKPVLNTLLNQCAQWLPVGGKVFIVGEKNQGIKSVAKNALPFFADATTEKHSDLYLVTLTKSKALAADAHFLDDKNYRVFRSIGDVGALTIASKPGLFGWDKIDAGSKLLINVLTDLLSEFDTQNDCVLDLGCGYGYLTLAAANLGFHQLHATDNNAAALLAVHENSRINNLAIKAWPDDIASQAEAPYPLVLCNPPFHQGYEHSKDLSQRFMQALGRLTATHGTALVVVNQFIKLEKLAASYFRSIERVAGDKSFSVYRLKHS